MTLGNIHPIIFQIKEVEQYIRQLEEIIADHQKQYEIPSDWLKEEFDENTVQFVSDIQKVAYQNIKRYQSNVQVYLNKIGLSRDMLRTISLEINTCNDNHHDIQFKIIEAHLNLVVSIAKKYRNNENGIEILEIIHEGNIGLLMAIDNFDYQRGYQFKTYATWWIRQAVSRAMADRKHINEKI